jgi:ubiquitin carboxyl-terminal hydrolase L3
MPQTKHAKVFPPLESDPALFTLLLHKLGASSTLHFEDVLSLEETGPFAINSKCIQAFVLISPFSDNDGEALERIQSQCVAPSNEEEKAVAESVIWVKQTIHNACGFYALLHAVCNIPSAGNHFTSGSFLDTVINAKSMEERKMILETSQALDEAYIPVALQGQTAVSEDWSLEPPFHYVCFVSAYGRVWELNGGRNGPLDRGAGRDVVDVVRESLTKQRDSAYSLLALVESAE